MYTVLWDLTALWVELSKIRAYIKLKENPGAISAGTAWQGIPQNHM